MIKEPRAVEPYLSIVTGTLNRRASFNRLVKSIQERTNVPWELVVSDASDEPYPDQYPENVRIIPERPRLGCVKGYNRAFSEAVGRWVVWLNDDAEVQHGWAEAAVGFMEHHPEVGLGAIYYCEGAPPFIVNEYWDMAYANFGIVSRDLGNQVGWFDDDLEMYGCDNSLTFRVLMAYRGVATIPGSRIWHHSVPDQWKTLNQRYRASDAATLKRKYTPHRQQMQLVYKRTKSLIGPMVIGD